MAVDPKADAKHGAEEAPKSKKKLIIIIAAVLVLAIGGGAAWFLMKPKADAHGKAGEKKEEAKHEKPAHPPAFVPFEAFTVNLQPDPEEKFLQLEVSVQVPSAEEAEVLKGQMPALRNRILMLLTSKQASDISTTEGKQKLNDEITSEIKKPFDKEGKPQEISGVYFTSFVIQ